MPSLYEHVLRSLLVESKTDTYARRVAQKVMNAAKAKLDTINKQGRLNLKMQVPWPSFLKRQGFFASPEGRLYQAHELGTSPSAPPTINVSLTFIIMPGIANRDDVHASGSWSPTKNQLKVEALVETTTGTMRPAHFQALQREAYNVIRHELEHAGQDDEDVIAAAVAGAAMNDVPKKVWSTPATLRNYFLSTAELHAFVAGMYHQAKRIRTPFIKVVDAKLEEMVQTATKAGADINAMRNVFAEIRYRWLDYARKRFPKAIVS